MNLGFDEKKIPTKARLIQMNQNIIVKKINNLMKKYLIRPSISSWSCAALYAQTNVETERRTRLVINYKPLNKALRWI